jgi:hypothetical protein
MSRFLSGILAVFALLGLLAVAACDQGEEQQTTTETTTEGATS